MISDFDGVLARTDGLLVFRMTTVMHFQRRPGSQGFSVERYYADVRSHLPADIQVKTRVNRFFSQGILQRLFDAWLAAWCQKDVNHVLGDVHYLTYFMHRRRTVLTILDCVTLEHSSGIKLALLWLFWFWLPVKRSVAIVTISEATRKQVLQYTGCDPEKVRVIYCNVSDEFQPRPQPFNAACPSILHIGISRNKNLDRHAEALAGLKCRLVVVGQLSDKQHAVLQKHRIQYENFCFLSREEVVRRYIECDLLLFASTYEGFGLPIVEAQKVGRPVVTSNAWSMPEVAGDAACLVDPLDVQSIRNGVLRVISDAGYRESLVSQGFKNVIRFSASVIAEEHAALYREIAASSDRKPPTATHRSTRFRREPASVGER